ncbi:MAG: undecaprenyl/decaprenyl-phosphate alpha-N-acetylglucosaminyl 1-phosphate transferase [Ardenticatenaceae bacterium]|nr:undecaprenyl/decaprenyl-phosphate alpha-N-acetylglucosaminyl 1-phosphate transferase [Ardenticatenaceae bacterium]MCB8989874.1 undecaprenyl/decaprenyl-phosphate alpha-N-acetylglucosaminyl 1-phosphate transferase [Ardenticatenaceae bacterium]MCB9005653.1 undecaprenyl/decaprenyl-phosphate alpha-N-acetylglucosaminyl 1-phosphate transferase [Ardenticatenaceae bacterium]
MRYLIVFLASFLAVALVTPQVRALSFRLGMVARPGGRRQHQGEIPKLGGLALLVGLMVGTALVYLLFPLAQDGQLLWGIVLGTAVIALGGLLDDWFDLPPWSQFIIHALAAVIAVYFEVFIERFTSPFSGQVVSFRELFAVPWAEMVIFLLTFFWIVGMINTINFLDGLDGLASGVVAITAVLIAWHSYNLGQYTVAAFPLVLSGVLMGFLLFNFAPARIFLGSAGAYVLGYQIATLAIISPAKIATALLVLAVPILDVAWQIVDRLRRGQSPFRGDRGHLHFRLSDRGLPTRWIVLGYYAVALAFGLVAIFASGLIKVVILAVLATAVFTLLFWLNRPPSNSGHS